MSIVVLGSGVVDEGSVDPASSGVVGCGTVLDGTVVREIEVGIAGSVVHVVT
ncbi:MAG: hypothetical protein ACKVHU_18690 [Acidimicrobiales bacterium]|jgi:hypothetical protein